MNTGSEYGFGGVIAAFQDLQILVMVLVELSQILLSMEQLQQVHLLV